MQELPVVLTIAGSDNSAGAGIQADLKTISALGGYGLTALTCVVAEVPGKVEAVQPVKTSIVRAQIALSFQAFPVAAVKTGMLFSPAILRCVVAALRSTAGATPSPLVVDPVMVASSGDPLLQPEAVRLYQDALFPLATVITPNLDELAVLCGSRPDSLAAMEEAGKFLAGRHGCAVLCKGGHLREKKAVDVLISNGRVSRYSGTFRPDVQTHGTGCTYSAAIATGLARGLALEHAIERAKNYIQACIDQSLRWRDTQALHHFHQRT